MYFLILKSFGLLWNRKGSTEPCKQRRVVNSKTNAKRGNHETVDRSAVRDGNGCRGGILPKCLPSETGRMGKRFCRGDGCRITEQNHGHGAGTQRKNRSGTGGGDRERHGRGQH